MEMMSSKGSRTELLGNATKLLQKAKDGMAKRRKLKSTRAIGLTNFITNAPTLFTEEEIKLYIDAAEAFHSCGKWIDAAEAYAHAAWLMGNHLKQSEEAAILYTEAGLCAIKCGISEAVKYFSEFSNIFCIMFLYQYLSIYPCT